MLNDLLEVLDFIFIFASSHRFAALRSARSFVHWFCVCVCVCASFSASSSVRFSLARCFFWPRRGLVRLIRFAHQIRIAIGQEVMSVNTIHYYYYYDSIHGMYQPCVPCTLYPPSPSIVSQPESISPITQNKEFGFRRHNEVFVGCKKALRIDVCCRQANGRRVMICECEH